jgi:hypothetical protein
MLDFVQYQPIQNIVWDYATRILITLMPPYTLRFYLCPDMQEVLQYRSKIKPSPVNELINQMIGHVDDVLLQLWRPWCLSVGLVPCSASFGTSQHQDSDHLQGWKFLFGAASWQFDRPLMWCTLCKLRLETIFALAQPNQHSELLRKFTKSIGI